MTKYCMDCGYYIAGGKEKKLCLSMAEKTVCRLYSECAQRSMQQLYR